MPVRKTKKGCYKVDNTTTKKCMTKSGAKKQLKAIKASQSRKK